MHAGAAGPRKHDMLVNRQTGQIEIIGVQDWAEDHPRHPCLLRSP